jgi:hypothetical protein
MFETFSVDLRKLTKRQIALLCQAVSELPDYDDKDVIQLQIEVFQAVLCILLPKP